MNTKKQILIISEAHLIKTFVLPTIKKLKAETNGVFDCFIVSPISQTDRDILEKVFDHVYANRHPHGFIAKIPRLRAYFGRYGRSLLAKSLPNYDVVHINFHHYYFSYFTPFIRKKTKKFYITFYGSDFNQVENFRHKHNLKSVKLSDAVFTTNKTLLNKVVEKYGLLKRGISSDILIMLMDTFDGFEKYLKNNTKDKAKLEWGADKLLIACGYSAAPITQHSKIIEALAANVEKVADAKVIFPMTYGHLADRSRAEVKTLLAEQNIEAEVLEDYLPLEKINQLRLATDIFIHIQTRDQMAASMLEHLAAGSVVITGKWLPYQSLIDKGVFMIMLDSPDDLSEALSNVLDNLDIYLAKSKVNREIILNMMSWETIKANWYKYYELEEIK